MIWMWRNKAVNERSPPVEGQVIRSLQKLFLEHWRPKVLVLTRVPTRSSAKWCCINQGMLKLNCDAAIGDLSSCIAIVARDWKGKLGFAISKNVNTNIPIQAEVYASLLAVHIAINFFFCSCVIESDCKACIDAIKSGGNVIPWRLLNFVESIKNVINDYSYYLLTGFIRRLIKLPMCLPIGPLTSLCLVLLIWDLALQVLLMLSWLRHPKLLFLLLINKISIQQKKKKKNITFIGQLSSHYS